MRRTAAALIAALAVVTPTVAVLAAPAGADEGAAPRATEADQALATAERVLSGVPRTNDPSPTIALRDLRLALPRLSTDEQAQSTGLLARPTDGASDPQQQGYTVPSKRKCSDVVCVHWVERGADRVPNRRWVDRNLTVMTRTYRTITRSMNYRRPLADGRRGGNRRFDFYLKDIGDQAMYGYCAPERERQQYTYTSYCVLDNDFSREQYANTPMENLRVTASHEFFHAVQYAHDAAEDRWLMEATATWMEERLADSVNDNRSYLRYGQLGRPHQPLDLFEAYGFAHYGNWLFFEFLSKKHGVGSVRAIWKRAAAYRGAPDMFSTQAVRHYLRSRGGFGATYGRFAAANTYPRKAYSEGAAYTATKVDQTAVLSPTRRSSKARRFTLDHLTSARLAVKPAKALTNRRWKLRITVNGPDAGHQPQAFVTTRFRNGKVRTFRMKLSRSGYATTRLAFRRGLVRSTTVTLANASTATRCWTGTYYACQGTPKSDRRGFAVKAVVRR